MLRCLGILREVQHSPNRETDDALILKAVLAELSGLGISTSLVAPEDVHDEEPGRWDLVVAMCESYARIRRLARREGDGGTLWVNRPSAVLNCYRTRMVALLDGHPGLSFPPTEVRRVEDGPGGPPAGSEGGAGWWIKRGDVHNTCDRDVVALRRWGEAAAVLRDFAQREITHWVVQPHIPGDLIKFYGVGPGRWFTWFYHDPVRARRHPFDLDLLAGQAAEGARALELEVFGGDAIVSPDGAPTLIDLNSWPSFARVRREAAVQIAWHLQTRLKAAAPRGRGAG